ncbi:MAG TPA: DNA translocase FtsK 4TM domain-containing protein, partial [Gelidibacter sp.]|uniref:DNA translocase FtsK 4TM domain-containing protein n=1 Tax=Gelidibacter sp. TaxID=2018083 RepID=UPI002C94833B
MAKKKTRVKTTTTASKNNKPSRKFGIKLSSQQKLIFGSLLAICGILLFIAFLSFFFTGNADQSTLTELGSREVVAENWLNKLGAWVSHFFIVDGFGISSFIFAGLIFISGIYVILDLNKANLRNRWIWGTLIAIWISIFFGFFSHKYDALGGVIGF